MAAAEVRSLPQGRAIAVKRFEGSSVFFFTTKSDAQERLARTPLAAAAPGAAAPSPSP